MAERTIQDLLDCCSFGRLYRIDRLVPPSRVSATRVRRKKDKLFWAEKNQVIELGSYDWPDGQRAEVGDYLFIDPDKLTDLLKK